MSKLAIDIVAEEWRVLPAPYSKYEISSFGNCRNLKTGRPLSKFGKPYVRYFLHTAGRVSRFAHRLVAMAFLPETYREEWPVNHKDFNPSNNDVINLECISPQANNVHKTSNMNYGKRRHSRAIEQIDLSGNFIEWYASTQEAIKDRDWKISTIHNCLAGHIKAAY